MLKVRKERERGTRGTKASGSHRFMIISENHVHVDDDDVEATEEWRNKVEMSLVFQLLLCSQVHRNIFFIPCSSADFFIIMRRSCCNNEEDRRHRGYFFFCECNFICCQAI